jgi:hypothetical protein
MMRWAPTGMLRSSSPNRNHDGTVFHSGLSVDGSASEDGRGRPLRDRHQRGLLARQVRGELLVVLVLRDVEVGVATGQRDLVQRRGQRAAGREGRAVTAALTGVQCVAGDVDQRGDVPASAATFVMVAPP